MMYPHFNPMSPEQIESYADACNDMLMATGRGIRKVFTLLALRAGPQKSAASAPAADKPQTPPKP